MLLQSRCKVHGSITLRPRAPRSLVLRAVKSDEPRSASLIADEPAAYKSRVERSFDGRARSYDMVDFFHPMHADALVECVSLRPGERVLDVASGTGLVSVRAAQAIGDTGRVVAVDMSAGMLRQQEIKLGGYFLTNVDLVHADADKLEYDSDFDAILCATALQFFPDIPATLKRWYKWAKPGARVAFNAFKSPMNVDHAHFCSMAREYGLFIEEPNVRTGDAPRCRALMEGAGFTDVTVSEAPGEIIMSAPTLDEYAEKMWKMSIYNPFWPLEGLKLLPPDRLEEFRTRYTADIAQRAAERWDGRLVKNAYVALYVKGVRPM